jgi:hypothetical protein
MPAEMDILAASQTLTSVMVLVVVGLLVFYHFRYATRTKKIIDYVALLLIGLSMLFWSNTMGVMASWNVTLLNKAQGYATSFINVSTMIVWVMIAVSVIADIVLFVQKKRG